MRTWAQKLLHQTNYRPDKWHLTLTPVFKGASYNQPTYQNHLFETSDLHEREWIGGGLGGRFVTFIDSRFCYNFNWSFILGSGGEWSREEMWLQHEQQHQHQREQHRFNRLQQQQQMMVSGDMLYEHWRPRHMVSTFCSSLKYFLES